MEKEMGKGKKEKGREKCKWGKGNKMVERERGSEGKGGNAFVSGSENAISQYIGRGEEKF